MNSIGLSKVVPILFTVNRTRQELIFEEFHEMEGLELQAIDIENRLIALGNERNGQRFVNIAPPTRVAEVQQQEPIVNISYTGLMSRNLSFFADVLFQLFTRVLALSVVVSAVVFIAGSGDNKLDLVNRILTLEVTDGVFSVVNLNILMAQSSILVLWKKEFGGEEHYFSNSLKEFIADLWKTFLRLYTFTVVAIAISNIEYAIPTAIFCFIFGLRSAANALDEDHRNRVERMGDERRLRRMRELLNREVPF